MTPLKLEPLPESSLPPELWRQLATALEYEGWQEAETLYGQVHATLAEAAAPLRARALMDHARALKRVDKPVEALKRETQAEALLGTAIERDEESMSSVDELKESESKAGGLRGIFKKIFKDGKP